MKKSLLFISSFILAFISVEFFIQFVIGFPAYGVKYKLAGIRSSTKWQNVWKPNSSYFTVEGGLRIHRRNNLGFTGLDVNISKSSQYIAILGNSYLEAYQVAPEKTAVGILQSNLRDSMPGVEVVNLSVSGHDIFDMLYRSQYYDKTFKFKQIILVLNNSEFNWLKRHKRLSFNPKTEVIEETSALQKIIVNIRNYSIFFDLFIKAIQSKKDGSDSQEQNKSQDKLPINDNVKHFRDYSDMMVSVLNQYYFIYGNSLMILNFAEVENDCLPQDAIKFLQKNSIPYFYKKVDTKKNKIEGNGHLNEHGNKELGAFLTKAIYVQK